MTKSKCCTALLEEFEKKKFPYKSELLNFSGVNEYDVYNISSPFKINNKTIIAGRVEKRDVWADSTVRFFEEKEKTWSLIEEAPTLKLEDPFTTYINDEIVLGGVEVYTENNSFHSTDIGYRTVFYRGKCFSSLERFTQGPNKMKDIRLVQSNNGELKVCTRPQGGEFGRGQIGYMEVGDLKDLEEETFLKARIIESTFLENQWGGANELHELPNGNLGVLGHISYEDQEGGKHYYAMTFVYNPKTHKSSDLKILATRKMFPDGEAKKTELKDVIFPGGLVRHLNGLATLYAGLSDAQAGCITLPDPFLLE